MKKAIYAGSFDPIHEGHISIIKKGSKLFDSLLVVVANNPEKKNSEIDDRYSKVLDTTKEIKNVKVIKMKKGLIAEFAKENNVKYLLRSARDSKDFDFELMMALQNRKINNNIETILIMPEKGNIEIRSSLMPKS